MEGLGGFALERAAQVERERPPLPERELRRRRAGLPGAPVLEGRAVAQGPQARAPGHRHRRVDQDSAPLVHLEAEGLEPGAGSRTRRPREGLGQDLAVTQDNPALPCIKDTGPEPKLNAAGSHPLPGIPPERLAEFGKDGVARVDEDRPHLVRRHPGVVRANPPGKIVQGTRELDSCETAAGHDKSDQGTADPGVFLAVGALEHFDHVVANPDRIQERLEVKGVSLDVRRPEIVGNRAGGQNQMVKGKLSRRTGAHARRSHRDHSPREVDGLGAPSHELGPLEGRPQGRTDMARLKAASGDFRQHRREKEGIVLAHEGDGHRSVRSQQLLEPRGGRHAGKPTAHDDNPLGRRLRCRSPVPLLVLRPVGHRDHPRGEETQKGSIENPSHESRKLPKHRLGDHRGRMGRQHPGSRAGNKRPRRNRERARRKKHVCPVPAGRTKAGTKGSAEQGAREEVAARYRRRRHKRITREHAAKPPAQAALGQGCHGQSRAEG